MGLLTAFSVKLKAAPVASLVFVLMCLGNGLFGLTVITKNDFFAYLVLYGTFLFGPAVWWLVRCQISGRRTFFPWYHAVPAALAFMTGLIFGETASTPLQFLGTISRLLYGALAAHEIWANRNSLASNSSSLWTGCLTFLIFWDALLNLCVFIQQWLDAWLLPVDTFIFIKAAISMILAVSLTWWALISPEVYLEQKPASKGGAKPVTDFDKEVFDKLETYFTNAKPYLDANLSLEETANAIAVTARELSNAVNRCADKSFRAYMREFRVNHARALLSDPQQKGTSILNIAMDAGFGTTSAFHDTFKSQTGKTPTEYRKAALHS